MASSVTTRLMDSSTSGDCGSKSTYKNNKLEQYSLSLKQKRKNLVSRRINRTKGGESTDPTALSCNSKDRASVTYALTSGNTGAAEEEEEERNIQVCSRDPVNENNIIATNGETGETRLDMGSRLNSEQEEGSECEVKRKRKAQQHVVRRIWKYLKETWSGVLAGSEPILEDLELPHRYRPENLKILCEATGFSVAEMKRIYRGFKTECPSGLITEESFHAIYSRFFPHGAPFLWSDSRGYVRCSADLSGKKKTKKELKAIELQNAQAALTSYSHYVFSTLDHNDTGIITFEDFVVGLSILVRGTLEEKLRWTFSLYDQDRDGFISREEMEDVVGSVFDLMGRTGDPNAEEEVIHIRVDKIFEKLDLNGDGVVSMEEFLKACQDDHTISESVDAFTNVAL